jgi:hypothetical protein
MKEFFEKKYNILNESVQQLLNNVNMSSKAANDRKPDIRKKK